jgi:hypothetical protein
MSHAENVPWKTGDRITAISGVSAPERWFFFDAFLYRGFE